MYRETKEKQNPRPDAHREDPTRRITNVVVGGISGDSTTTRRFTVCDETQYVTYLNHPKMVMSQCTVSIPLSGASVKD